MEQSSFAFTTVADGAVYKTKSESSAGIKQTFDKAVIFLYLHCEGTMAKIFTILFAGFYLLIATGINVSAHWCGKKIRFVSIDSPHEKKCPCGKKMRPGCCKDIHTYFKIRDTQKASSQVILPVNDFAKALTVVAFQKPEKLIQQVEVFDITNYHAPPFKAKLPVYLSSRILRI